MAKYKDIYEATTTIKNLLRFDTIVDESGIIYKDYGDKLQMIVPVSSQNNNKKDYDTIDIFYDNNGNISKITGHHTNSYFTGTRYY